MGAISGEDLHITVANEAQSAVGARHHAGGEGFVLRLEAIQVPHLVHHRGPEIEAAIGGGVGAREAQRSGREGELGVVVRRRVQKPLATARLECEQDAPAD